MARRTISLRWLTVLAMSTLLTFAATSADAQKKGGVLRVGNLGEPVGVGPRVGDDQVGAAQGVPVDPS